MQNNLEHALCLLALATYLTSAQARLIPIVCAVLRHSPLRLLVGIFEKRPLGRAPGVQLTFALNTAVLALALLLFVRDLIS